MNPYGPAFLREKLEKIVCSDSDVITECGITFGGNTGEELIIAAAILPGAVTISTSFARETFKPEFPLEICERRRLA